MVRGMNYPPPPIRAYAAQALSFVKLALIVCIAIGQNPFVWLNMTTPNFYYWAMNNKIFACMMLFFIGNAVEGQLVSTGAFEVSFNDVPVWSKLETGRIPSGPEMFEIIENSMRLHSPSSPSSTTSQSTLHR
jgi:selT/selW/selH-like putative selenoprotein